MADNISLFPPYFVWILVRKLTRLLCISNAYHHLYIISLNVLNQLKWRINEAYVYAYDLKKYVLNQERYIFHFSVCSHLSQIVFLMNLRKWMHLLFITALENVLYYNKQSIPTSKRGKNIFHQINLRTAAHITNPLVLIDLEKIFMKFAKLNCIKLTNFLHSRIFYENVVYKTKSWLGIFQVMVQLLSLDDLATVLKPLYFILGHSTGWVWRLPWGPNLRLCPS